jgi:putative oxidoreductase
MNWLFQTSNSFAGLILRLGLGVVMFPHGMQKLLGWFGGGGFKATMEMMTTKAGLPEPVVFLVIIGESLGSIALILGFMTRFTALSMVVIMAGAAQMMHWKHGFFMNWYGAKAGEGFEYHILAIAIGLALTLMGGGRWSLDQRIAKN